MTATTTLTAPWYVDKKFHLPLDATWPRRIFSHQHAPVDFRGALPKYSPFPYVVFLPGERYGVLNTSPRQLIALTDNALMVINQGIHRKSVISDVYPLDSIVQADVGNILLLSWLTVRTASQTAKISFPSVADHLFEPILDMILKQVQQEESPGSGQPQNEAKLGYLRDVNLKLFNAAGKYLDVKKNTILETAYQPEVELSSMQIFRTPVYKKHLAGHLAVLTETALLLFKESQAIAPHAKPMYGGIMTYLPLRQIRHVAFEDTPGKLDCVMNVILSDNSSIRTEFSTEAATNLTRFKETCLRKCTGRRS